MWKWLSDLVWNRHLKSVAQATERDAIRMAEFERKQQPPTDRPNRRRLANGCWLLRTQAGFMQALREDNPGLTRKEIRNAVTAWPEKYPAVVRISKHGHYLITVTALPLDEYRAQTQALLDDLAGE